MEKLSGLILDLYDDKQGEVLRSVFPSYEHLPEMIKTCSALNQDQVEKLPDSCFALILHDGDVTLRKFACVDAGHTALGVEYFMKTGHKLPAEAQKVAAQNLVQACSWYEIEPPADLQKIALGLGSLAMGALVVPGAARDAQKNLQAVKGTGGGIITPPQMQQRRSAMGV